MSLLDDQMEGCILLCPVEGEEAVSWQEGERFRAAILPASGTLLTAEKEAVQRQRCTIVTPPDVLLSYGDMFRRERDAAVFRVISDSADVLTPARAAVRFAQCRGERWK